MFRIVCNPSSGSRELYLTENIRSGSQMFVVCLVGVWQRNFEPGVCVCVCVCVYGTTGCNPSYRPSTRKTSVNHYEYFQSSRALYSLMMDRIRSETCWSDF